MSKSKNLSIVQKYILDIFKVVIEELDKEHIMYYLQGGTMLGAIRHKGFVPWDDDVDIGIFREDYEKFLNIIKDNLPEYMELQTYWDESSHHYYFARIVDKRYKVKRIGSAEERYENVWTDIFPLDGMPNNPVSMLIHKFRLLFARLLYSIACVEKMNAKRADRTGIEKLIIKFSLATGIGKKMNAKKRLDKVDRLLKKYPVEGSKWIINFMGQTSYKFNQMFSKECYGKGKKYEFEDLYLYGPEDYDGYLSSLYGDYMTPPPKDKQNVHALEIVENDGESL